MLCGILDVALQISIPHWETRLHQIDTRVYTGSTIHDIGTHSGMLLHDRASVDTFLRKHLLHWLEALSLIKSMSNAVSAIAKLTSMVRVSHPFP